MTFHKSSWALVMMMMTTWIGCIPSEPNELDRLGVVSLSIKSAPFSLWIADSSDEQMKGLMFVTADQMTPLPSGADRGMIFVFPADQSNSFWMKNTIIPLDIAYVASDGRVVKIFTMAPLDERHNAYPPGSPYRYAVEVNANRFTKLGLQIGDKIELPESVTRIQP